MFNGAVLFGREKDNRLSTKEGSIVARLTTRGGTFALPRGRVAARKYPASLEILPLDIWGSCCNEGIEVLTRAVESRGKRLASRTINACGQRSRPVSGYLWNILLD